MLDLDEFQRWLGSAEMAIELRGSDEDVDLLNRVLNLVAEYTGNHITAEELTKALQDEIYAHPPLSLTSTSA